MASTGKTTNYELSQFIGTDKPSWLGDYNGDMLKIDTALGSINATATTAQSGVASAQSAASAAQMTANAAQQSATANAQSITALKGDLKNSVLSPSQVGSVTLVHVGLYYNAFIKVFKGEVSYSSKPTNTTTFSNLTRIPFASFSGNVLNSQISTLADDNYKTFWCVVQQNTTTSSGNKLSQHECYSYYDGANTVFYTQMTTAQYTEYTTFGNGNFMGIVVTTGSYTSSVD